MPVAIWWKAYGYGAHDPPLKAGTASNPDVFTGGRLDSETGPDYHRNRYYGPELRLFIEPDPIGFEGDMNLHAYAGNVKLIRGD